MTETAATGSAGTAIRLVLLDVDGVLTDGTIIYGGDGGETKSFHVRDGLGIRIAMGAGIGVGVVTGRRSPALMHRCRDLGIDLVFDGVSDKAAVLAEILETTGLRTDEVAFVGDDLVDLPIMKRVGLAVAVADAHPQVKTAAEWVTTSPGGKGAVREVIEIIMKKQGLWESALEKYLR